MLIVSLFSCTRTTVEIASRNFGEEIERQQNLIFTFDLPLVADSLTNNWDTLDYIHFVPEVKGKFKWNTPTELVFSPLSGFAAATDYTAELQRAIVKRSPKSLALSLPVNRKFTFHTPYLNLTNSNAYWAASATHPAWQL